MYVGDIVIGKYGMHQKTPSFSSFFINYYGLLSMYKYTKPTKGGMSIVNMGMDRGLTPCGILL